MKNNNFDFGIFFAIYILIILFIVGFFINGIPKTVKGIIISKEYIPKKIIEYKKCYLNRGWKTEEDIYPEEYWFKYKYDGGYKKEQVDKWEYYLYDIGDEKEIEVYYKLRQ